MEYLREYIKKNVKFEAVKEEKASCEHFFGKFLSLDDGYNVSKIFCKEKEYELQEGMELEILIHTPRGVYSMTCEVAAKTEDGWKLAYPTTVRHSQRREFLRAEIRTDVSVTVTDNNGEIRVFKGVTDDICAGGVSLDMDFNIDDYSGIDVELVLNGKTIVSEGELAYCKPVTKEDGLFFHTAIIMASLGEEDTNFIADECFKTVGNA